MVNSAERAEVALALSYARARDRAPLEALLALDETLGRIVRTTRDPLVGQMRLTWWFEALERLDMAPPPAEPVLQDLARAVLPRGLVGAKLATMIEGWEALLEAPLDEGALAAHAVGRGGQLFALAGRMIAEEAPVFLAHVGEGWALADLGRNLSDEATRASARQMASSRLREAHRWPRSLRTLGALALLARDDIRDVPHAPGHPARTARLLALRVTGR